MIEQTTTECRVRWDRTDRRHVPMGEDVRICPTREDAEAVARHQRQLDIDGVDGVPVGNPLTMLPVIESRQVTEWVEVPNAGGHDGHGSLFMCPTCEDAAPVELDAIGHVLAGAGHNGPGSRLDGVRGLPGVLDRYRDALDEIISPPDASKGEDYGCLDLHEAREIARTARSGDVDA